MTVPTEVAALAEYMGKLQDPSRIEVKRGTRDAAEILLAPVGLAVHSLKKYVDEYLEAPERLKGTATLTDMVSFTDHVKRFKKDNSAVFASAAMANPFLLCVYDYSVSADKPLFAGHRSLYKFPLSEEWNAWMKFDDQPFRKQEEFAQFIEDRIADIGDPNDSGKEALEFSELIKADYASPSKLLQLSTGIELRVDLRAAKKVNLSSGETQIQFAEEHDARGTEGPMKVPGAFLLNIPIFEGDEDRVMLPVRLRYRLSKEDGNIHWSYSIYRADKTFDNTLRERAADAATEVALPLFYGAPEA